ncbi:MAG TPA: hypothetical protein DHV12_02100 [Thermotogae bacterium]|nr:hypothetical protein [Thermotogota bacterium]
MAERYLKSRGFKIIARNFATRFGELDIIARKSRTLVFVEVKGGTSQRIRPRSRLDPSKFSKMRKVAEYFLKTYEGTYEAVRFDLIEVYNGEVLHVENIHL